MAMAARAVLLSRLSPLQAAASRLLLRPLAAAATLLPPPASPAPAAARGSVRCFATQPASSSLRDTSPNWSNRPPKETILLDGCDFEHWLVVMEPPPGDASNPEMMRDEIIDGFIKTLAQVAVGDVARYWLAEHPAIVGFRWSPSGGLWFSTWAFLLGFLAAYVALSLTLDALLAALRRKRPLPLGAIPSAHAFLMAAVSAAVFAGTLVSAVAEIRDTRWSWRGRSRTTPLRWLLCFPPGTRSSGRVFFWSYAYYLSRYLHAARGLFAVLRRRRGAAARVFAHAAAVAMAFLWLEFSQSFQVLAILASTLAHVVAFGFRAGLPAARAARVAPVALVGCNVVCHAGVLWMHFGGAVAGGCSGIGAWLFNTLLNAALLWVFLHCYGRRGVCDDDGRVKEI